MGIAPREVWALSLWEFHAMWAGWKTANTVSEVGAGAPTLTEHQTLVERAMTHG